MPIREEMAPSYRVIKRRKAQNNKNEIGKNSDTYKTIEHNTISTITTSEE